MRCYRILTFVAWVWVAVGIIAFFFGMLIAAAGAPNWLPLPWSEFEDFTESTDGKVYVSLKFYQRVLCYDASGRFLASYRAASGGGIDLASDLKGRIFVLSGGSTYELRVYDSSWHLLAEYRKRYDEGIDWRLDENGDPVLERSWRSVSVVDRAAGPGEFIFSRWQRRGSFACADGSRLVRKGNHLERYTKDGHLVACYSGPLIFYPLTFPWPAATAWLVVFLLSYVDLRRKHWRHQLGAAALKRKLLLDVAATFIVALVFAAVWFTGLALLTDVNNAQPDNSPWRPALLVLVIFWFFLIPVAGFRAWAAIQKRFAKLGGLKGSNNLETETGE